MEIERVDFKKNDEKAQKEIKNKKNNLDYLLYFSIAGLIIPFGIILSIYVLFKIGNLKVSGNLNLAKFLAWFQVIFTIIMFLIMILFFPNFTLMK